MAKAATESAEAAAYAAYAASAASAARAATLANGATRLQPLILNIGQAAGMAAALAIQGGRSPSDLPPGDVQRSLIDDGRAPAAVMPLVSRGRRI